MPLRFLGITFERPSAKTKQFIIEQREKAKQLQEKYIHAKENMTRLDEALSYFSSIIIVGDDIQHKIFGSGKVEAINEKNITIYFESKKFTKKFGLSQVLANAIVSFDKEGFMDKVEEYMDVLKDASLIPKRLEIAVHSLEPYEEYL